ncbi:Hint domain-containing protein [Acetobacter sp. P5B1]|uniref:Hint domain-containing protein n=1 Tax=Acetobacter sp. P5B1 TaxID=2762620 RepID=UPI001C045DBA|nr:Hint domain-containing protein [Acetobacter sp. P5B1]
MTKVTNGTIVTISNGQVSSGITVDNYGTLVVAGGGTASSTTVGSNGGVALSGSAIGTTVSGAGVLEIGSGGVATSTTVTSGKAFVDAGGTLNSTTVDNYGTLVVAGGGTASSTTVGSNGGVALSGSAIGTTVSGAGVLEIGSGGVATSTTVTSGQVFVDAGGTLNSTTVYGPSVNGSGSSVPSVVVSAGGNAVSTVLSSGGNLDVYGTVVDTTVNGGATETVLAGGLASGTIADNGGVINIQSGGQTYYTTAGSGGVINVASGGSTWYAVIDGGTLNLSGGGNGETGAFVTNSTTFTSNGGTVNLDSGYSENRTWTVPAAVTMNVTSGATLSNAVVSSGGDVTVASGGVLAGTVTVQDGGSAVIGPNAGGVIDLQGDTNGGLVISGLTSGGTVSTVISGFSGTAAGNSDSIELSGVKSADVSSVTYPSADQVALTLKNGGVVTLNIPGVESKGFSLTDGKDGWLDYEVCFLSGSMIQTPNGEVAVEALRLGDDVTAYVNGMPQSRRVVWAGKSHATVRPHLSADEAGYPVRILKNAIAEGVPYKDMLITPEHCLFFYGRFVPARMLVNGSSIFYDTSITSYDYFHVETEEHSVLRADGMLTESYLDTGNRRTFRQDGSVLSLGAGRQDWATDAAVPLCVERAFVEPLFHTLAARADAPVSSADITTNPDLHLVTQSGALIRPVYHQNAQYRFMLPPGVTSVRIVSRASRPSDTVGPYVDDRRMLGVAIADIDLITVEQKSSITAHLQTEKPSGWYDGEAGNAGPVWTNGDAYLPLPALARNAMSMLSLDVCAAGPYLLADQTEAETAARSA